MATRFESNGRDTVYRSKWVAVVNKRIESQLSRRNGEKEMECGKDPKNLARSLQNPCVSNFFGLRSKLRGASTVWVLSFLEHGGLDSLFQALENLGKRQHTSGVVNAFLQLECVLCIRSVMNTKTGMDFILENKELSRLLTQGLNRLILIMEKLMTCNIRNIISFCSSLCWRKNFLKKQYRLSVHMQRSLACSLALQLLPYHSIIVLHNPGFTKLLNFEHKITKVDATFCLHLQRGCFFFS